MRRYLQNLLRPWKVVTFVAGTAFFVWGAYYWALLTWDVAVSVLMSVACYLLAPLGVSLGLEALRERRGRWWLRLLGSAAIIYFVGSGTYELYHLVRNGWHPPTYWENLFFSVPVTIVAGILWRYDGSLRDLLDEIRRAAEPARSKD